MTHRIADQLAATLAGMLIALLMVAAIAPAAWLPTPRPSPQPDPPSGGMTTERISPLPSPETAARTGTPDGPAPLVALPEPSGTGTAALAEDADPIALRGIATWYDYRRGHAAAGPELRRALGAGWRGTAVLVCADRCVRVVLSDFMVADRLIDLDRRSFAVLADPSRGILAVTVTLDAPAPPDTTMGDAP